ncbi:MAG TPA: hypothetical protein VGR11_00795 [Solirubrobacteraceae bacterium]|nr:hypothetical protein [Solirubrobacteraceae bacterium]
MAGMHGGAWGDEGAADGDEPHGLADDDRGARMHDDIPIRGYNRGEPVPDLALLPRERWREVLRALSPYTRQLSKNTVSTMEDAIAAGILVGELITQVPPPSLSAPPPMPRGVGDPPERGPRRQVNFRLSPDEHGRLLAAARSYGMRSSALARLLTVRGVDRMLYDERRAR